MTDMRYAKYGYKELGNEDIFRLWIVKQCPFSHHFNTAKSEQTPTKFFFSGTETDEDTVFVQGRGSTRRLSVGVW